MKRYLLFSFLTLPALALALFAAAPGFTPTVSVPAPKPAARALKANELSKALNQFSFELYQTMAHAHPQEPMFASPFSVYIALAMATEGMGDGSRNIMQSALHLPESEQLHIQMKQLLEGLTGKGKPYSLAIANAIWPDKSTVLKAEFAKAIEEIYQGKCSPLDFIKNAEASRLLINAWVEKQTQTRIKNLLPGGSITPLTRMVITNAIYFKADWEKAFDKDRTQTEMFYPLEGEKSEAELMFRSHDDGDLNYGEWDGAQVLEIPYSGDELSMLVCLPPAESFLEWKERLDFGRWEEMKDGMAYTQVDLRLPKFKLELGGSIKDDLSKMGMESLFSSVDMSRMFEKIDGSLKISDVFHKAFVEVGEEGTEAAAATAVVMTLESASIDDMPDEVKDFRADHPFLFAIQHRQSGAILFMGRVMDPKN
jgi:serpin B